MNKQDIFIQRNKDRMDIDTLIGVFADKFNVDYIEAEEIVMKKFEEKKVKEGIDASKAIDLIYEFARENDIDEFDLAQGMSVFVHDFMGGDVMPLSYYLSNELEYRSGISGESYEELDLPAQMVYDELVSIFGYEHYIEKENKGNVLTINEEVTIGEYILEVGDTIKVLKE